MAGDYHLQANVDMRALAILAKARLESGLGVRSIAQLAKDVIEQAALDLIEAGEDAVEYSEEAMEMLQRMGLLRPSGTSRAGNFREHIRAIGSQEGFSSSQSDLETRQKRRERDARKRGSFEPSPDMMQQALEAMERVKNEKGGLTQEDKERIKQSSNLMATEEELDKSETPQEAAARREREEREMLRQLNEKGNAPLETPEEWKSRIFGESDDKDKG